MAKNKTVMTAVIIVLLSGGVIFFGGTRPVRQARDAVVSFFRPMMFAAGGAGRWFGRKSESEEVRRLTEENERLTAESFDREKLAHDIEILESALAFRKAEDIGLIGGRVLSYTHELGREILVIDQGASAGVKKGDLVVDGYAALVGEVDDTGGLFSRVAVASNAGVSFPVFLMPAEGGSMLARGLGARAFSVELIPRSVRITQGDFVARRLPGRGARERAILTASIVGGDPDGAEGALGDLHAGDAEQGIANPSRLQRDGFASARAVLIARPETLERVFIIPSHE